MAGMFLEIFQDLVDHRIILQKLGSYGFRDRELLLFESYYSNRKQYVNIYDVKRFVSSMEY